MSRIRDLNVSDDPESSPLVQLIHDLVALGQASDAAVLRLAAGRCLGEVGPAYLGVTAV